MAIILGIDALEYACVNEFGCKNLLQKSFGKTDISEYEEPRTIVLWSSFLAGKNLEKEVLALGNKKMWDFRLKPEQTFLKHFSSFKAVDVPGYSYSKEQHELERSLLKKFFNKEITAEEFAKPILEYHQKLKQAFLSDLEKGYGLLFYYFNAADVVGHVSFGQKSKMRLLYQDLDEIAKKAAKTGQPLLIISDHGMKAIGSYGDHNPEYGFWSTSFPANFKSPKITDFSKIIAEKMARQSQ